MNEASQITSQRSTQRQRDEDFKKQAEQQMQQRKLNRIQMV